MGIEGERVGGTRREALFATFSACLSIQGVADTLFDIFYKVDKCMSKVSR